MSIDNILERFGAFDWTYQRISGVALVIILALHFIVIHFMGSAQIDYASVMARMAHPLWKAFDLAFLYLAITHSMGGAQIIIDDYVHLPSLRSVVILLNWLLGLCLAIYGTYIIISLKAVGV